MSAAGPPFGAFAPGRTALEAMVVCVSVGAVYAAAFTLPPAVSELDRVAGLTHTQAGLVLGVFTLSFALTSPLAAHMVRRYPRNALLPPSVAAAGILTAVLGAAPPLAILIATRAAMGFAVAVVLLSGLVAADRSSAAAGPSVGWVLASVNIGIAAAYMSVPMLGSVMRTLLGLQLTGAAIVTLGLSLGLLVHPTRRRSSERDTSRPRSDAGTTTPPESPASTMDDTVLVVLLCSTLFTLYGVLTWYPVFLKEQVHLQSSALALLAAGMALVAVPASLLAARSLDKGAHPFTVSSAGFLLGASVAALWSARLTSPLAAAAIGLVSACGLAAALVPLYAVIRPRLLGRANLLAYAGAMVAVWLGGALVGSRKDYSSAFLAFAVVAVGAASLGSVARSLRPGAWRLVPADGRCTEPESK